MRRLAAVVDCWIGKRDSVDEIKAQFDELELFEDFETRNANLQIEQAWRTMKMAHFSGRRFWQDPDWNGRYLEMLIEARQHPAFQNLFPGTSHMSLWFGADPEQKAIWNVSIIPTTYCEETPETLGKFHVSWGMQLAEGRFFDTARAALDFVAQKIDDTKPIRWDT